MTEKGKPVEKQGRKAEDLREVFNLLWWPGCLECEMYFRSEKMFIRERDVDVIDQEWMELILEARDLGLSIEDVRNFLYPDSQKEASSTY